MLSAFGRKREAKRFALFFLNIDSGLSRNLGLSGARATDSGENDARRDSVRSAIVEWPYSLLALVEDADNLLFFA